MNPAVTRHQLMLLAVGVSGKLAPAINYPAVPILLVKMNILQITLINMAAGLGPINSGYHMGGGRLEGIT